jgi:hypothetical protein
MADRRWWMADRSQRRQPKERRLSVGLDGRGEGNAREKQMVDGGWWMVDRGSWIVDRGWQVADRGSRRPLNGKAVSSQSPGLRRRRRRYPGNRPSCIRYLNEVASATVRRQFTRLRNALGVARPGWRKPRVGRRAGQPWALEWMSPWDARQPQAAISNPHHPSASSASSCKLLQLIPLTTDHRPLTTDH